ncbi:MAG: hypothetical protein Kow0099_26770 [Candidatus Abyssubacteria bacterium]
MTRKRFLESLAGGAIATAMLFRSRNACAISNSEKQAMESDKSAVIRVYDPEATSWNYRDQDYLDYIHQDVVNEMFHRGIMKLAGAPDPKRAWEQIMPSYRRGDRIAIKPNFNSLHLDAAGLITCPQLIGAVVKSLVESLRVAESDIYVYDLCKRIPQSRIRARIGYRVEYVERRPDGVEGKIAARLGWGLESADRSAPITMSVPITDSENDPVECYVPKVLTQCQHLINIALLSNHPFLAISGPLKNHFGTVRFSNYQSYPVALHGEVLQKSIVDINMNPHIRTKTRLVMCDALFGQFGRGDTGFVEKWNTFPTDNGVPNSLFLATDPVALESVLLHLVNREREARGLLIRGHDYLHIAARKGLGIHEDVGNLRELENISYETV